MAMLPISLSRSTALRDFRKRSGHTTQHLLTLIVGADAVRRGAEPPQNLPASWDPKSREDAAGRARTFAIQAATVWTAESVIGYVTSITRASPQLLDASLKETIDGVTSRDRKLIALSGGIAYADTACLALVRAGLVWRNRLTHVHATNRVNADVEKQLHMFQSLIAQDYQGLHPKEMVERIHGDQPPRLKESAALNRAASALVRSLDELICSHVNPADYLDALLRDHLAPPVTRARRAEGLWGGTQTQNRRSILNLAAQKGLRTNADTAFASDLPSLTPKTALARFGQVVAV